MPPNPLLRTALVLSATGIVSASSVRYAMAQGGSDLPLIAGYAFYLALLLIAISPRPPRWMAAITFALVAITYVLAVVTLGGNVVAIGLYVVAAYLAFLATPPQLRPLTVAAFALWTPALRFFGPDPFAGEFPPLLALAAVLALGAVVAPLIDRRARDHGERMRRIGLGLLAVAAVATVVERHLVVSSPGVAPDDVMALVVAGALPLLVVARVRPATREALATGLALAAFALTAMALLLGKGYHVDAVTVPHHAAELLLAGENPYRSFDLPEALAEFGLDPELATHLEDGRVLRSLSYPAMSFLVVAPAVALGATDIRWVYVGEILVLVLLLLRRVRSPWRPLVAAGAVGNTIIVRQNILAGVDPTWALLVMLGWLFLDSPFSAVAIGLAAASRQPAWFVAPFYLVVVWRRAGRSEALWRAAVVAVAALLPNLPFIVDAPREFFAGISAPMLGALAPSGIGLVGMGLDGLLPLLPRGVYGGLSALSFVALIVTLWRFWPRIPGAAMVFPFVPLYLGWRSLQNYFCWLPLLAMAGDDELLAGSSAERLRPSAASALAPSTIPAPASSGATPSSTAP